MSGRTRVEDGRVRIRAREPGDAAAIVEVLRAIVADGRGAVMRPEDVPDAARYRERLQESEGELGLVLELDGELVAEGAVSRFGGALIRHVGLLSMGVHPSAQGLGLGRRMLEALVEGAAHQGVGRPELYVRADNARARRLYESSGFELEGIRRRFVRLEDGTELDDCIYVRFLD